MEALLLCLQPAGTTPASSHILDPSSCDHLGPYATPFRTPWRAATCSAVGALWLIGHGSGHRAGPCFRAYCFGGKAS